MKNTCSNSYYWSKYNYIFQTDLGKILLYNSFSNIFMELDEEAWNSFIDLKEQIEKKRYKGDHKIHDKLLESFIISKYSDADVLNLLKLKRLSLQTQGGAVSLTIVPTMDCNFRCSYCFEEAHLHQYMNDELEDKIVKYIHSKHKDDQVKITWFGGEPLLAFARVESISKRLNQLEINLTASLITNGYLLNEGVINRLEELKIRNVQVTIDGIGEKHNRKRPHQSDKDNYSTLIKNLSYLHSNLYSCVSVSIRVNVDKSNENDFITTYNTLKKLFPNFHIYPGIITNTNGCVNNTNCLFDREDLVRFICNTKKKSKLNAKVMFPEQSAGVCTAERINDYVIGVRGELYKCWNDVGREDKIVGSLLNSEHREERGALLAKYISGCNPLEDKYCLDCFMLPQCNGGGCAFYRMQKKYEGAEVDYCTYFRNKLNTFLEFHYQDKEHETLTEINF